MRSGVLRQILERLAEDLRERGKLDLSECLVAATFVSAERGRCRRQNQAGQRHEAHGSDKRRWCSDRRPRSAANPHEITLVEATVAERFVETSPARLIGDRAYDSDPMDRQLAAQGIELSAPHRNNRIKPPSQGGRALRRYRRRWKVERLFAWLSKLP
ncbi:transposase [Pelomicrobium methylotrophicum]|uniref:Transposase n=1 Tax=Pelomicrobium methylotrophicum TaxID=2602750 RepID=A0A5C7ELG7_9PROT|nr:transposase [Pelomicrobium methylotrophicum]TXF13564.1 transposase [Pelomicrobium methylotrophicum]